MDAFFCPNRVAIFGSFKEFALGCGVIQNMLDLGYKGRIYPVSQSHERVMELDAFPTISDVQDKVDLAIVITPSATVPHIVEQCGQNGVKAAVVVSEHFAEAGKEGARLQQQIVDITIGTGIRVMGPNTIGVLNTHNGLVSNPYLFDSHNLRKGSIAYSSQTGIAAAQCQPLADRGYGISKMCDIGNKCDVDEVDIINYLADDSQTKVITMHLEDVKDGRRFLTAAKNLITKKPLLILKTGRSEAASKASASHTGSLTGNDVVYDAAFKQIGAIRVDSWQEFWDIPKVFAAQPLPKGNRIGIISYSGGAGVAAADTAAKAGLTIPVFSDSTLEKVSRLSPRKAGNPIDLGPILSSAYDPISAQEKALVDVFNDVNIDCVAIGMYVGRLAPKDYMIELFDRVIPHVSKPFTLWLYGPTLAETQELARILEGRNVPTYTEFETAVKALGAAAQYQALRNY